MKKRAIPRVPPTSDAESMAFNTAVKERLELMFGVRGTAIKLLEPSTATTAEVAAKLNELIALLQ
jgi:hypothetical protein